MNTLWPDIRFGTRLLARTPSFTLAAVLSMALGIGATAATFNLIRPLLAGVPAVTDEDRLAFVWAVNPARGADRSVVSLADFADWRAGADAFDGLAAWVPAAYNLAGAAEPVRVTASRVTANFFDTLGIAPVAGRMFGAAEAQPGAASAAVLSHGLWTRAFGGDRTIVGRTITLDGRPATVVGIAPDGLDALGSELWTPLVIQREDLDRGQRNAFVVGRLAEGATAAQAAATLRAIAARLERDHPATNAGWTARVVPFAEQIRGPQLGLVVALLGASVGLVLLIGCVNVANLLVARSEERRDEFALRAALGAGRRRLAAQMLTESVMLGAAGGLAGLLLSWAGTRVLRYAYSGILPIADRIVMDGQTIVVALAISLATAVLFGLGPAWRSRRTDVRSVLAAGGRGVGSARSRVRSTLVAAEVALAVVLLVVTGLFVRTVIGLEAVRPGFDPQGVVTMRVTLPELTYEQPDRVVGFYDAALERIRALPGIEGAGATSRLPIAGSRNNPIRSVAIEGRPASGTGDAPWGVDLTITPGYLEVLGVPLVTGRHLSPADRAGAEPVVVVSETFAGRYFGGSDAVGRRIALGDTGAGARWSTIVGVVGDVRNDDVDQPPLPQIYLPLAQQPGRSMSLLVRTAADPIASVDAVRRAVRAVDTTLPVYDVRTMTQILANDTAGSRAFTGVLGTFAVLALLLASAGIYGVVAGVTARRRHEIGIRLALGATSRDIYRSIVGRGMQPVLVGLACGLGVALALAHLIASVLFGVSPSDPATFGIVSSVLVVVALAANSVPAARALRIDPLRSLRQE